MTSPQARKGRRAEIAVADYLRTAGFDYAEPTRRSGWADDRGDIDGIPGVVVEVKDAKRHELGPWMTELEAEVANAGASHGVLVVKRRGHSSAAGWYAVMPLADWALLAKDAGL
jgi:hypothetical protein